MTSPAPRILIVDDVPDNVGVLFDFLREQGFKVLVSESGEHALAELPGIAPDLILLDVMMPGLDGFEVCRRLKADTRFAEVPVFFMTALNEPVDKVRGFAVGAADYIAKPIFPEEVLARIKVHLALRDARRALEERNRELADQNERLDAAIQLRLQADRALRESLDRAVFVADMSGRIEFITESAAKLLRNFFPEHRGESLPTDVAAWLRDVCSHTFEANRGHRRLALSCPRAEKNHARQLVYLEEKAPPPSPELLRPLGLTPRETEILFWVAQGKTSPEIAIIVGSAATTVKKHVENITAKLGVETRLAAALKAMELMGVPTSSNRG